MNVYLINNESYHLIDQEVKKIVKNNPYTTFNLNKSSIKEVIEEASYFGLGIDEKYLVVNNADIFGASKISDDESDTLLKYFANPNPKTCLIFTTTQGIDSRKKIVKEIKNNGNVINTLKMDRKSLSNFLNQYLKDRKFSIDYQALNYIIDNSYNCLDIMINELEKVMIYYAIPSQIKYEDVCKIVGEELDSNNFHFVNAIVDKNISLALKLLSSLKVYKVEPTILVSLLAREYRLMYYVKNLQGKISLNEMMSRLSLADWQINKLYTNATKYSNSELLTNLVSLCNIDLGIKKGLLDKEVALYGFILDACS